MSESFAELFEQSLTNTNLQPGAIVIGTVVAIENDHVIVNAGLKSEGVIPKSQFTDFDGNVECVVGDQVEVALDAVEDGFGATRLSREKAKRHHAWHKLEKAFEAEEIVVGRINGKVKGGFTVELDEIRAVLPGSLVDVRPVRDTSYLEGKDLEFKVIKLDQKRNNVVVSRRAVVEQEYSEDREKLLESLQEGQEVKGVVKNLTDYGAFVDLGGSTSRCSSSTARRCVSRSASSRWAKIRGRTSLGAIQRARVCSGKLPTSPTMAHSSRSRMASKAWCMSRRWTGPTRMCTPAR
jgi:small subunit ribosomal protein S1